MGKAVAPRKLVALTDKGDAHGLSIAVFLTYVNTIDHREVALIPAVLGEVYTKFTEVTQRLSNLGTNDLMVADLPVPMNADLKEKTIEFYKKLYENGINVYFFDHHPTSSTLRKEIAKYFNKYVVTETGYSMTKALLGFFELKDDEKAEEILLAGNYADIDCPAIKVANDKPVIATMAKAMDYLLRTYGYEMALALVANAFVNNDYKAFEKWAAKSPVNDFANKLVSIAKKVGDNVLLDDSETVMQITSTGWFNKAVNEMMRKLNANVVVVPSLYKDFRTNKYVATVKVYGDPCSDVMSKVKELLKDEQVEAIVGHKSFAIVILKTAETMEELENNYREKTFALANTLVSSL